jgi:acetyl-CoA carboxylase carboxyltransferase component
MSTLAVAPTPEPTELTALERLEVLCDPGSLEVIRSDVISQAMGEAARSGDGVVGGAGLVDGRPVFCYAQDAGFAGGSLGEAHANTIVRVLELADRARAPVVGFVSSGGARMQEGVAALGGYGRVFHRIVSLSGRVPQISVITGLSAGGGAYSPALTDWIVMTDESSMFLTGPAVVREALGEDVTATELGGTRVHERNGVCHFVAPSDLDAASLTRELLGYLPSHGGRPAPLAESREPSGRDPGSIIPTEARRVYDVRDVIGALVDGGELLEVSAGWARSIVTGVARLDGRTVGVIANQPKYLGGVLDANSAQKGARFVAKCNAFGIPLLVLVDTPGYMPGTRQESAGLHARHQAGVGRRHQVRRGARPCIRRGHRPAGDGDPPQGIRWRVHHDELEGPGRRLRVRVAPGGDRGDGCTARRRHHPPPRAGGGGRSRWNP